MKTNTIRRLPDGEELVLDADILPNRLRSPEDDPRASALRNREAATRTGRRADPEPVAPTASAPRKAEG